MSAESRIKTLLTLFHSCRAHSTVSHRGKGDPQGKASDWRIGVMMLFLRTLGGGGCSFFIHRLHPLGIGRCCCHSLGTSGCVRVNQMQQSTKSQLRVVCNYSCFHSFLPLLVYYYNVKVQSQAEITSGFFTSKIRTKMGKKGRIHIIKWNENPRKHLQVLIKIVPGTIISEVSRLEYFIVTLSIVATSPLMTPLFLPSTASVLSQSGYRLIC